MPLFVTLLEGPDPQTARAIFATDDPRVIAAVRTALRGCLSTSQDEPSPRVDETPRETRTT
jgi:hypothetical protein